LQRGGLKGLEPSLPKKVKANNKLGLASGPDQAHDDARVQKPYFKELEMLEGLNYKDLFILENESRIFLAGRVDDIEQANAVETTIKASSPEKPVLNCLTLKKVCATSGFEWDTHLEYLLTTMVNKPVAITKEGRDGLLLTVLNWSDEEIAETSSLLSALGVLERVRLNIG
jgi:hypothetical protein